MEIELCCANCGGPIRCSNGESGKATCATCGGVQAIPEAAGGLPSPNLTSEGPSAGVAATVPAQASGQFPADGTPATDSRAIGMLTALLPWLASVLLHGGVLLILVFTVTLIKGQPLPQLPPIDPDTEFSPEAPAMSMEAGQLVPGLSAGLPGLLPKGSGRGWAPKDSPDRTVGGAWGIGQGEGDSPDPGKGRMEAYGLGGGGGSQAGGRALFGMGSGGGSSDFFRSGPGRGGNAYYVIYVIDHSGSVLADFEGIREELKDSILRLNQRQFFHVVFFSQDKAEESPAKRLVPADEAHKREAVKFLNGIRAEGFGSSPIPALAAAFRAFRDTTDKRGKVLYILTDGEFEFSDYQFRGPGGTVSSGTEAVIAWLRANNRDGSVHVYLVILGSRPSPTAEESLKKIAEDNGGEYKCVELH